MYPNNAEILRIWVLKTLGSLSRQYTVVEDNKDRTLMLESFDGLKGMLRVLREDMSSELENAAVSSLVDYGHHLQHQIADFFTTWKPKHPLWPQTTRKLEDFFGTRGRKHAEITCRRVEIDKQKETKRKIRKQMAELRQEKSAEMRQEKSAIQTGENPAPLKDSP